MTKIIIICIYFHGGNICFFNFVNNRINIIPFELKLSIDCGDIKPGKKENIGYLKNMLEWYPSYIKDAIDYITDEQMTLRLYRMMEYTVTHNIFTSILYTIPIILLKDSKKVMELLAKNLDLHTLDIINTNYYIRFNSESDCRRLVLIETKIYFWWNLFYKDFKFTNDNIFFAFYLWCFLNLDKIDLPGSFNGNISFERPFVEYFKLIDNCTKLHNLFILRYGPKYLSLEELYETPDRIFDIFDGEKCKENLQFCILKSNGII